MSPPSDGPRENGPAESPRSCPLRASPAPLSRIDERAVARIIERGPALNSGHARKGRGCRPIHGRRREAVFAAFADAPENPVAPASRVPPAADLRPDAVREHAAPASRRSRIGGRARAGLETASDHSCQMIAILLIGRASGSGRTDARSAGMTSERRCGADFTNS